MNKRLNILILLIVVSLSACATCNVPNGSYSNFGGSEEYIQLVLESNYTYKVRHETWRPGEYENKNVREFVGKFSCKGMTLTLNSGDSIARAKVSKVGDNPLGIDPNSEAMKFGKVLIPNYDFLNNEILYSRLE